MRLRASAGRMAMVCAAAAVLSGCAATTSGSGRALVAAHPTRQDTAQPSAAPGATATPDPTSAPATSAPPPKPVHVSLLQGDGAVYGVGMPIIAYFDRAPSDPTMFEQTATVTVNGKAVHGYWYWQKSGREGAAVEAHYRLSSYWPAHAKIYLDAPVKGVPAGKGLAYDNSLTLSIETGAANIAVVDGNTHRMSVTSDDVPVFTLPVSLGAADTPTYNGVKVVMEKNRIERMRSEPGAAEQYDLQVPWSVRLTNSGEFVHSASWNGGNIGVRSTSHGCTNLTVADAKRYFEFANLGDVVIFRNTGGPRMPVWDGYGDWNLPWAAWKDGGALH